MVQVQGIIYNRVMKNQRNTKLSKILRMYVDLCNNDDLDRDYFMSKYDLTERSVQRYIKALKDAGVPIIKPTLNSYSISTDDGRRCSNCDCYRIELVTIPRTDRQEEYPVCHYNGNKEVIWNHKSRGDMACWKYRNTRIYFKNKSKK